MKFTIFYTRNWSQYWNQIYCSLVLFYCLTRRVMMLLVAQKNMLKKWAFTRKKSAGNLKALSVPIFTFNFALLFDLRLQVLTSRVQQKPHLCRHAEVAHREDAQLFEEWVPWKFNFIALDLQKVCLHLQRTNLHYVPNIQILNPFILIEKTEYAAHVWLIIFVVILWMPLRFYFFLFDSWWLLTRQSFAYFLHNRVQFKTWSFN